MVIMIMKMVVVVVIKDKHGEPKAPLVLSSASQI